jgi:hypothetical protein
MTPFMRNALLALSCLQAQVQGGHPCMRAAAQLLTLCCLPLRCKNSCSWRCWHACMLQVRARPDMGQGRAADCGRCGSWGH